MSAMGRTGAGAARRRRSPEREARADRVRERLAAAGLDGSEGAPGGLGPRLAAAALDLGPVFTAYARYLGTRGDLLPPADCLLLDALPDATEPAPPADVLARVADGSGRPAGPFAAFDPAPFRSGLVLQWHRASTPAGRAVTVALARPGLEAEMAENLPLLGLLRPAGAPLAAAAVDFADWLARAIDLDAVAAGLAELAADAGRSEPLRVPEVLPELSSRRMLVCAEPEGVPLDAPPGAAPPARATRSLHRLARAWLRQALFGAVFPEDLAPGTLLLPPGHGVLWRGGPVARASVATQEAFGAFLVALSRDDPEAVHAALSGRLTVAAPGAPDEAAFLLRLRQVVPFRDGAWSAEGSTLPEHAFAYLAVARGAGRFPRPDAVPLVRGLTRVAALARRLDPGRDPLRDALREVRLEASFGGAPDLTPADLLRRAAPYATLLSALPGKLDALLTLAADEAPRLELNLEGLADRRRRTDAWTAVVALAAVFVALVVVVPVWLGPAAQGGWSGRVVALAAAVAGLGLLRAAAGGGRSP